MSFGVPCDHLLLVSQRFDRSGGMPFRVPLDHHHNCSLSLTRSDGMAFGAPLDPFMVLVLIDTYRI